MAAYVVRAVSRFPLLQLSVCGLARWQVSPCRGFPPSQLSPSLHGLRHEPLPFCSTASSLLWEHPTSSLRASMASVFPLGPGRPPPMKFSQV